MATIRVNSKGFGIGTTRNDTIYGDNKTNILAGDKGNDTLWGKGGADLIDGGRGNDRINAGSGNDIIAGGWGRDTLTGGSGADIFVFDARLRSSEIDTITDFNVKADSIWLDQAIFKEAGEIGAALKAGAFWTGSKAHDEDDRIIYNKAKGALYYDPDGSGAQKAVQFAKVKKGLKITEEDFFIV